MLQTVHLFFSSSKIQEGEKGTIPPFPIQDAWISYPALLLSSSRAIISLIVIPSAKEAEKCGRYSKGHCCWFKAQGSIHKEGKLKWKLEEKATGWLSSVDPESNIFLYSHYTYFDLCPCRQLTYCLNSIESRYPNHPRRWLLKSFRGGTVTALALGLVPCSKAWHVVGSRYIFCSMLNGWMIFSQCVSITLKILLKSEAITYKTHSLRA